MAHAENTIVIKKSPDSVYAFLADGMNNPTWRPTITEVVLEKGAPGTAGAVYRQQVKSPGGRARKSSYEITAAEPGRKLEFVVMAGPARPLGVYRLEAIPEGTKLNFTLDFAPHGLLRLLNPIIQRTMENDVKQLAALKSAIEGR
jgi:hypothetical protein